MAQSVKRLALDLGLGHDPRVMGLNPELASLQGMEPAWDSLSPSPSPSACLPLILAISQERKKKERKKERKKETKKERKKERKKEKDWCIFGISFVLLWYQSNTGLIE